MLKLNLIPYPKKSEIFDGEIDCCKINLIGEPCFASKDFAYYACKIGSAVDGNGVSICYCIDDALSLDGEGYIIDIAESGINIKASAEGGIRYAFCTLRQLLHNYDKKLPLCHIEDEPYLKHRGMLLDSGRYYFPKADVLKLIDLCYMHKLNKLHWHLTEDQGWRIEIDKYPLLTQKGSKRSHTNFGVKSHGGYYTKEEIREVIAYANERGIEVFPEIDMPGHMQSALACYPYLGCFDRQLPVATHWGVKHDILCAGKDSTYDFVCDVLDEVIDLFKCNTNYIHIGADEVFKHRWRLCKRCNALMQQEGLKDVEELQVYFMKKVCDYVVKKGMTPICWNGVESDTVVNDKLIWQFWSAEHGGSQEVVFKQVQESGGYINSDNKYLYIDFPYSWISLKDSFAFKPLPDGYPAEKLVGAELTLWEEYVPDFKTACRRLLPRACSLAEAMWLESDRDSYEEFEKRLAPTLEYLEKQGFKGAPKGAVNPKGLRKAAQSMWFNRRQLHWQGLHNLIDDAKVKGLAKKQQ